MPIYEYQCAACGHRLEAIQKLSDDPLRECPACKSESLSKLVSAPSFRLSGSGWYETDFKSDGEKKRNLACASESASSSDKEASGAGASAKSETASNDKKPATSETKKTSGESAANKSKAGSKST